MGLELFASQSAGALGMLMTGWAPSTSPPPVGAGMDPFHPQQGARPPAVSRPWSHGPEESWPPPHCEEPGGTGFGYPVCTLFTGGASDSSLT